MGLVILLIFFIFVIINISHNLIWYLGGLTQAWAIIIVALGGFLFYQFKIRKELALKAEREFIENIGSAVIGLWSNYTTYLWFDMNYTEKELQRQVMLAHLNGKNNLYRIKNRNLKIEKTIEDFFGGFHFLVEQIALGKVNGRNDETIYLFLCESYELTLKEIYKH